MMACGSHSQGLAAMRDCTSEMRDVSKVIVCDRNDSRNVYSGGGSWSDKKSRRGSRKGGSGESIWRQQCFTESVQATTVARR